MRKFILPFLQILIEMVTLYFLAKTIGFSVRIISEFLIVYFLFMVIFDHYTPKSTLIWVEMKSLLKSHFVFLVVAVIITQSFLVGNLIKVLLLSVLMFFVAFISNRTLRIILRQVISYKTLVLGTGYDAKRIAEIASNNRFAITLIEGFIDVRNSNELKGVNNPYCLDDMDSVFDYDQIDDAIKKLRIDQIIIVLPDADKEQIDKVMQTLYNKVKLIKYTPRANNTMTFASEVVDFDGVFLISSTKGRMTIFNQLCKRVIDIIVGILGCLLLLPIYLLVRYKYRKDGDNDSIIFKQHRIGKDGRSIEIYKFRSMIPNAEQILEDLMKNDPKIKEEYLTNKKLENDPRITSFGKKLRKTSLDEFPQFINVLKGEMSFVGPRPYLFREKEDMGIYYNSVIECKPGITGMWQANGRSDVNFEDRCKLDDYYYRNWTLGLDFIIIYKTIKSVLYGKGAL